MADDEPSPTRQQLLDDLESINDGLARHGVPVRYPLEQAQRLPTAELAAQVRFERRHLLHVRRQLDGTT